MGKVKRFFETVLMVGTVGAMTTATILALAMGVAFFPTATAFVLGLIWGWMIRDWMSGNDEEV